jgi:hypothetical protein
VEEPPVLPPTSEAQQKSKKRLKSNQKNVNSWIATNENTPVRFYIYIAIILIGLIGASCGKRSCPAANDGSSKKPDPPKDAFGFRIKEKKTGNQKSSFSFRVKKKKSEKQKDSFSSAKTERKTKKTKDGFSSRSERKSRKTKEGDSFSVKVKSKKKKARKDDSFTASAKTGEPTMTEKVKTRKQAKKFKEKIDKKKEKTDDQPKGRDAFGSPVKKEQKSTREIKIFGKKIFSWRTRAQRRSDSREDNPFNSNSRKEKKERKKKIRKNEKGLFPEKMMKWNH